jgi:hypothetical protein
MGLGIVIRVVLGLSRVPVGTFIASGDLFKQRRHIVPDNQVLCRVE